MRFPDLFSLHSRNIKNEVAKDSSSWILQRRVSCFPGPFAPTPSWCLRRKKRAALITPAPAVTPKRTVMSWAGGLENSAWLVMWSLNYFKKDPIECLTGEGVRLMVLTLHSPSVHDYRDSHAYSYTIGLFIHFSVMRQRTHVSLHTGVKTLEFGFAQMHTVTSVWSKLCKN